MDFVILFGLYLGLVLLSAAVCVSSRREQSFSWRLIRGTTQVLSYVIPAPVHRAAQKAIHGLFHSRNSFFVVLHLILEGLVYGEYTWEVFIYGQELQFSRLILLLPYLLLAVNATFFILCSKSNPGIITKSNQLLFLNAYAYDGLMFQQDAECPTCAVRKPARSRHCSVCCGCIHRFDHHCVWVNNCIGAFNIRFFLCYLLTLTSMAASIAAVTAGFLIQVVLLSNLTLGHYTDEQGQEHPVDTFFLIQELFLAFPRIVFMLGFVILLLVILGSYFCFILYLVLTNQTSNEWFKSARYTNSYSEQYSRQEGYRNIYSKGVWANLAEIVTPLTTPAKKRK
ncbi:probable palmitoyltransferase ZDHHC4 isoform X2 [Thamnophis elegans]|uniref:probable palmitoyltransferase ZDHHC4 isoform X2 n=1 Tax=Thamnophis elegans TaxID=35005 RepID=UPI0013766E58|nr:probable palmitoyltransferase ZDHHC4 isoform X2 [Thamnophis elegans]